MRRRLISELFSAGLLLLAGGVAAAIMAGAIGESHDAKLSDTRSRLDDMRARALEQIDVSGTDVVNKELVMLVHNYGEIETGIPLAVYKNDGTDITDDFRYYHMNGTEYIVCGTPHDCIGNLYGHPLEPKGVVTMRSGTTYTWQNDDVVILLTQAGKAIKEGVQ